MQASEHRTGSLKMHATDLNEFSRCLDRCPRIRDLKTKSRSAFLCSPEFAKSGEEKPAM